jgi:23S rRNA (cytidine1920-2'-O)/16S rRNA (cytidine1409-2'-O)-methyltransferase
VGHGQLHPTLREDARVLCLEGINARSLTATELIAARARSIWAEGQSDDESALEDEFDSDAVVDDGFDPVFDLLTGDLSFISLTLVLPAVVRLLKADGDLLMLVKPQFELQPGQIGKGGIVREPALFEFVEKRLTDTCTALGLEVLSWTESPIQGGDGNREFFIHARKGQHVLGEDIPLAAAPARSLPKRTPRSETRALHAAHEDSEDAHAGQHGPARRKQRE